MEETIKSAVKQLAGSKKVQTLTCKVISVDWSKRECHVEHDSGLELFHCRLRSVIDTNATTGLCLKPKINSMVTVQLIENQDQAGQVIGYSDVDAVELKMQNVELSIENGKVSLKANEIEFNGGNNHGLVLIEKLVQQLNRLEAKHNQLVAEYNSHTHNGNFLPSPVPLPTLIPNTLSSALIEAPTTQIQIENTKIKQ